MTATSITFQWDSLTVSEANGIVRSFTVTCTPDESPPVIVRKLVSIPLITNGNSTIVYIITIYVHM